MLKSSVIHELKIHVVQAAPLTYKYVPRLFIEDKFYCE